MRISVYIATTLDGFIARSDGGLDWLEHDTGGEDYGYDEFFRTVDLLVMGRGTFETVLSFGSWPYGDTETLVLSRTLDPGGLPDWISGKVRIVAKTPGELAKIWREEGRKRIYLDGGKTIRSFLKEDLVTDMTLTLFPLLIGTGIPLFGEEHGDIRWKTTDVRLFPSGLVQTRFERSDPLPEGGV